MVTIGTLGVKKVNSVSTFVLISINTAVNCTFSVTFFLIAYGPVIIERYRIYSMRHLFEEGLNVKMKLPMSRFFLAEMKKNIVWMV